MGYTCWKTEKAFFRPGGATAGATANNRNAKPRKRYRRHSQPTPPDRSVANCGAGHTASNTQTQIRIRLLYGQFIFG